VKFDKDLLKTVKPEFTQVKLSQEFQSPDTSSRCIKNPPPRPTPCMGHGGVRVLCCWGVTQIKVCAATVLELEGQCPGIKFQTKKFVHSGSRICSPKPKSRSSTDAILPSFVINTCSLAVLGIQSSSSSMNESVLYQTMFPC
jgi:hypothetical protein